MAAHLPLGKVFAKLQVARLSQQRPRGNASAHLSPPLRQPPLQIAHALGLIRRKVGLLGWILGEIKQLVLPLARRIEELDQFPVAHPDCPTGNAAEKMRPIQRVMPMQRLALGRHVGIPPRLENGHPIQLLLRVRLHATGLQQRGIKIMIHHRLR